MRRQISSHQKLFILSELSRTLGVILSYNYQKQSQNNTVLVQQGKVDRVG
jgi:hypothetical protein